MWKYRQHAHMLCRSSLDSFSNTVPQFTFIQITAMTESKSREMQQSTIKINASTTLWSTTLWIFFQEHHKWIGWETARARDQLFPTHELLLALEKFSSVKEGKQQTYLMQHATENFFFFKCFHSISRLALLIGPDLVGVPIVMTTGRSLFLWRWLMLRTNVNVWMF